MVKQPKSIEMPIVTRQSLQQMLDQADHAKRAQIVGRALVALFKRQTEAEKAANVTNNDNGVGFASCDAKSGSLTAKSYLRNRTLEQWQVEKWLRRQKNGFARLTKYAGQLNEIAEANQRGEQQRIGGV
jgi:hypothetical protein